jgi:acyl-CoA-dependent ceramide synthase
MSESNTDVTHTEHEEPPSLPPSTMEHKPEKPQMTKAPSRPPTQSRNSSMNGPLYMQTVNNKIIIRRVKRKGDGPLKNLARWLLDNQTGTSRKPADTGPWCRWLFFELPH